MTWSPDVPFPAEDLGTCRGCGATIGWVQRESDDGPPRPHPVDPRGWHGQPCGEHVPACKKGYTADGFRAAVIEFPPSMFPQKGDVVFTSHFSTCPKRERFFRNAKARESRP